VLVLLGAAGGGFLLIKGNSGAKGLAVGTSTPAPTRPAPTPTGFGDATNTPVPTNTPAPPPANVIAKNGWVQIQSTNGLVLRDAPSRNGKRLTVLSNNSKAHVVDGPQDADGYKWWKVDRYDSKNPTASGWVAGQFLAPTAAP